MRVGSVYTRIAAGVTDSAIESGQTVTVHAIVCNNTAASAETVTIEEASTTTVIQTITVPAGDTVPIIFPNGQLFHRGLQVTTPATTSVSVFHSHGGS